MISHQRAVKKKVDKLVFAAERLAAVQYEAGLRAAEPAKRQKVQAKVNRCWQEFRVACDALQQDYTETPTMVVRWAK